MILDKFALTGKVAIVTGAGRSIGRGIALGFAEAGADIVCAARTVSEIESVASEIINLFASFSLVHQPVNAGEEVYILGY